MLSIKNGCQVEIRHFMDDEHQITIGIDANLWPVIQSIANANAAKFGWLNSHGSNRDYLNIWIIGRIHRCPVGIEPWEWVEAAVIG